MNRLKFTFGSLYAVLILLLLLLMLKHCEAPRQHTEDAREEETDEEIARNVGQMGDLKVTLLWDKPGDADLHVVEPNGAHIYFENLRPRNGKGHLDTDNRQGGRGSAENIYWTDPDPGHYKLFVHYFAGSGTPIPCRVLVFRHGELIHEYECVLRTLSQKCDLPDIVVE